MPLRRLLSLLPHLFLLLLLCAAGTAARAGDTYTFAGNTVNGCTLSAKTYTCPALPLPNWNDKVVISGGYTVTANGDVTFGYDQGLAISGGGTLKISGNLNIGNIQTSLLQVNGATLVAGKTFSMGAQVQTIVADISAATMNLGTGSQTKITGKIAATGAVNIASNTTIVGPISGTTIVTTSPVTLTGDVTATTRFYLASHSTIKGNIVAPTVETDSPVTINGDVTATQAFTLASGSTMTGNVNSGVVNLLASGVQLTGKVMATTSLQMGSGNTITGDVVTGELTLDSSNATIVGNATVNHATLNWAGRVTETIYCAAGNTPGQCDCVTNNSGWDIRKNAKSNAQGPYCEGKTGTLDHFVISHDATASVCAPMSVTVTACANASCSVTYNAGATVTVQPGGKPMTTNDKGVVIGTVQLPVGTSTLSVSRNGATQASVCRVGNAASNCTVAVSDIGLALSVGSDNSFFANIPNKSEATLTVKAQKYDPKTEECTPLFTSQQDINFWFTHLDPASSTAAPTVDGKTLTSAAQAVGLLFNDKGAATTKLTYPDAGSLKLNASFTALDSKAKGDVTLVVAPARFDVAVTLPAQRIAGSPFTATVKALNTDGKTTPSFGKEQQPVIVALKGQKCHPFLDNEAVLGPERKLTGNANGVQTFALQMNEAGSIDLLAFAKAYLGSGLEPTGTTNTGTETECTGAVGPFVPAYFAIDVDPAWQRTTGGPALRQYYSGEQAIRFSFTALNLSGEKTSNYTQEVAQDVTLQAIGTDAQGAEYVAGTFVKPGVSCKSGSAGPVCAEEFKNGAVGTITDPATLWGKGKLTLASPKSAPLTAKVRATDKNLATSAGAAAVGKAEPQVVVRQGRVRLSNVYVSAGKTARMPVNLEYWTGTAWTRNVDDSRPAFPSDALPLTTSQAGVQAMATPGAIEKGAGIVELKLLDGASRGTVNVALNLGSGINNDQSCAPGARGKTPGVDADYLRVVEAICNDAVRRDPWAHASFGIFAPENRRIIHVREVFR